MTSLRPYQQKAHDLLIDWMYQNEGNPCLVLPTGAGKSHIVAHTVKHALTTWPGTRITMLTHRKELIAQNFSKLLQHWPQAPVGIYSAALKQKNIDQITFGGVQSVRGKAGLFGHQDLVIIDECHLISHKKEGVYRNFIDALTEINPHLRVVGLTATPWRLGHGTIIEGDALFDDLIEPVTIIQLIDRGFLAPLRSKHTDFTINTSELKVRGGEYISKELQESVNDYEFNLKAVLEIIQRAEGRRHWLIFCAGVEHAESIASILNSSGIKTAVVHGELNGKERDQILSDFKSGVYRAVTNCDVLTTGFDFPDIDLLVMLRPTLSPSLYVQMVGRGMRLKSHTDHCMVLDFAGNVKKHGPITNVTPPTSRRATEGDAPIKICDNCHEICHAAARICPECGAEFEVDKKKSLMLHNDDIMGIAGNFMAVSRWIWSVHTSRRNQAQMLKVKYYPKELTENPITEYLTINHAGWAGTKARRTLANIMNETLPIGPADLESLTDQLNKATPPVYIEYRESGKFPEILTRGFNGRNDVPNGPYLARMPISIIEKERKLYAAVKHVKSLGVTDKQIDEICRREAGIGLIHVSSTSQQKMDNVYNSLLDIAPIMV